jgi:hypothetical protein
MSNYLAIAAVTARAIRRIWYVCELMVLRVFLKSILAQIVQLMEHSQDPRLL